MALSDSYKRYKQQQEEIKKRNGNNSVSSSNTNISNNNSTNSQSSLASSYQKFKEYAEKSKQRVEDSRQKSIQQSIDRANNYREKYSKAYEAYDRLYGTNTNKPFSANDYVTFRGQYGDVLSDKAAKSYKSDLDYLANVGAIDRSQKSQMLAGIDTRLLKSADSFANYYKQYKDYNDYLLNSDTDDAKEARRQNYQANKQRLNEVQNILDSQYNYSDRFGTSLNANYLRNPEYREQYDALVQEKNNLQRDILTYERSNKFVSDSYDDLKNNADYEKLSKQRDQNAGYRESETRNNMLDATLYTTDGNGNTYDVYGNLVTEERRNELLRQNQVQDKLGMYLNASEVERQKAASNEDRISGTKDEVINEGIIKYWNELNEDEINNYYYLYNKEGKESAERYLDSLEVTLGRRNNEKEQAKIANAQGLEHVWLAAKSVIGNVFGGAIAGTENIVRAIEGKDVNPYSVFQSGVNYSSNVRSYQADAINQATGNQSFLGISLGDVYQSVMSAVDSAVGGGLLGAGGYGASMGLGAMSSTARDLYENGATTDQIFFGSLLSGIAENVFETLSVEKLLAIKDTKSLRSWITNMLKQAGTEASEEVLTEIANKLTDMAVRGTSSETLQAYYNYKNQGMTDGEATLAAFRDAGIDIYKAGVGGLISGGLGAGVRGGMQLAGYQGSIYDQGRRDFLSGNYQNILSQGQELSQNNNISNKLSIAQERLAQFNEEQSRTNARKASRAIGRLSQSIDNQRRTQNISDIQKALKENGVKGNLYSKAEAINDAIDRGRIGEEYAKIINSDPSVRQVYDAFKSGDRTELKNRNKEYFSKANGIINDEQGNIDEQATIDRRLENIGTTISDRARIQQKTFDVRINDSDVKTTFDHVANDTVYLKTDSGDVVSAEDVDSNANTRILLENAPSFGVQGAKAFINGYDGKISATEYTTAFQTTMAKAMRNLMQQDVIVSEGVDSGLSESASLAAYYVGKNLQQFIDNADTEGILSYANTITSKEIQENIAEAAKGKPLLKEDNVTYNTDKSKLSDNVVKQVQAIGIALKAIGREVVIEDQIDYVDDKNRVHYDVGNAYFYKKDNTYHISKNAMDGAFFNIAIHETVHDIAANNPDAFKKLSLIVNKYIDSDLYERETHEMLIRNMAEMADDEEMIANITSSVLNHPDTFQAFADRFLTDEQSRRSFLDLIDSVLDYIKAAIEKIKDKLGWQQIKVLENNLQALEDIRNAYFEGLEGLANTERLSMYNIENQTQAERENLSELSKLGIELEDGDAVYRFSARTWGHSEAELADMAQRLVDAGFDEEYSKGWVADIDSVYTLVMEEQKSLDYRADERYSFLKKNSDYTQGSIDFNNNCPKRVEFTALFDRLLQEFPNTVFTDEDFETIRGILKDNGIAVTCGICFVEDRRQKLGTVAQTYIDMLEDGSLAPMFKNLIKGDTYIPTQYDLITYEGFYNLWKNHPGVYESFRRYNNHRGMASIRLVEGMGEYRNEIKKWTKRTITSKNNKGGLRIFSTSDADPRIMLDTMQIVADAASKGLQIQGYTKKPWFAKLVKDTGIRLLRSHIPAGIGYESVNGKEVLTYDNVEGINRRDPDYFDSTDSLYIGNNVIGINDHQIRIAMTDPMIDQIIPFHSNQRKEVLNKKKIGHYENYKLEQTDKVGYYSNGEGAVGKQINIYTQVIKEFENRGMPIKNKYDFVNAYLQVCKEKDLCPRFWRFLDKDANGDYVYTEGYHKFLVDYKMFDQDGNYIPQVAVKPQFDSAYATEVLRKYVKFDEIVNKHIEPEVREDVYSQVKNAVQDKLRYSVNTDSLGNELSEQQQEYFNDSKVRDEDGKLLVVYHGSPDSDITEFDRNKAGQHTGVYSDKMVWFTDSEQFADDFSYEFQEGSSAFRVRKGDKGRVYPGYLNITNPFDLTDPTQEMKDYLYSIDDNILVDRMLEIGNHQMLKFNIDYDELGSMGYDGIIAKISAKEDSLEYGVFDSNQFKDIDNKTPTRDPDIRYSLVVDDDTVNFLENQDHVEVYRAMAMIDGKLYPPMATKIYNSETGKYELQESTDIGKWYQSEERPELADENGKFPLKKDNGKVVMAAYAPYWHTSLSALNDQFTSAFTRPNLVVVKGEVPVSELTSGYKAEKSKKKVGKTQWHSGTVSSDLKKAGKNAREVILSRWFKATEVLSDAEVAQEISNLVQGTNVVIPFNVVTPGVRAELEKIGVPIGDSRGLPKVLSKEIKYSANQDAIDAIDLTDDTELANRIKGLKGSPKYKAIQNYIIESLYGQDIELSDGTLALVDKSDAAHIAHGAADKKTAQIAKLVDLIEKAQLYAVDNNATHVKFNAFKYYRTNVKYGNEIIPAYLNVGKAKNDGSYHLYDITEKIKDTAIVLGRAKGLLPQMGIFNNNIQHDDDYGNKNSIDLSSLDNSGEQNVENLKNTLGTQYKLNIAKKLTPEVADKIAGRILKDVHSSYDRAELSAGLTQIINEAARQGKDLDVDTFLENGTALIRDVLEKSTEFNQEAYDEDQKVRDYLTSTKIKLTNTQQQEVTHMFDSVRAYRASLFGSPVKISSSTGQSLDVVWNELSALNPVLFPADASEGDMPVYLADAAQLLKKSNYYFNPYGFDADGMAAIMFADTIADYTENKRIKTVVNQMKSYGKHYFEDTMKELNRRTRERAASQKAHTEKLKNDLTILRAETSKWKQTYDELIIHDDQDIRQAEYELKQLPAGTDRFDYEQAIKGLKAEKQRHEYALREYMKMQTEKAQELQKEIEESAKEYIRAGGKGINYAMDARQAVIRTRSLAQQKQLKEQAQRRAVINTVRKNASNLLGRLLTSTDTRHVPENLRTPVANFLQNLDLGFTGEETNAAITWIENLGRLSDKMKNFNQASGTFQVDDMIIEQLDQIATDLRTRLNISGKNLNDMTLYELQQLRDTVSLINAAIYNSDRLLADDRKQRASALAERSMNEMAGKKQRKFTKGIMKLAGDFFAIDQLDSFSFAERMGKDFNDTIFRNLRKGFDKKVEYVKQGNDAFARALSKLSADQKTAKRLLQSMSGNKAEATRFDLENGRSITLTPAQVMELYLLNNREDARRHIYNGGLTVMEYGSGKNNVKKQEMIQVTESDVKAITDSLTTQQKSFAESLQQFAAHSVSEWGNNVSMTLWGIKKFTDPNYWRINVDSNTLNAVAADKKTGEVGMYHLKNIGVSKQTNEFATNPLIIGDIVDSFVQHVDEMSSYGAYTVPLDDAMKWYNYKNGNRTVQRSIENYMGVAGKQYFVDFIKALNSAQDRAGGMPILDRLISNAKVAAIAANLRVVVQQPSAYARAMDVIDPKYLVQTGNPLAGAKEAQEHSSIAAWKNWGFRDADIGQSLREVMVGDGGTIAQRINEVTGKAAGWADDVTWGAIWNAVKAEVKDKNPGLRVGSAEYWNAVSERFTEVVDKTQVVDSPFHRSKGMRSKNMLWKMATAFMSEPTKSYNMFYRTFSDAYQNGVSSRTVKRIGRAAIAFTTATVLNSMLASIIDAIRHKDDDEEKDFWTRYLEEIGQNLADNMNPLNLIPIGKDIVSMIDGYSPSRIDLDALNSLIQTAKKAMSIINGDARNLNGWRIAYDLVGEVSKVVGIPAGNILRTVDSISKLFGANWFGKYNEWMSSKTTASNIYKDFAKTGKFTDDLLAKYVETKTDEIMAEEQLRETEGHNRKYATTEDIQRYATNQVYGDFARMLAENDERIAEAYNAKVSGDGSTVSRIKNVFTDAGVPGEVFDKAVLAYGNSLDESDPKNIREFNANLYSSDDLANAIVNGYDTDDIYNELVSDSTAKDPEKTTQDNTLKKLQEYYQQYMLEGNTRKAEEIIDRASDTFDIDESKFDKWSKSVDYMQFVDDNPNVTMTQDDYQRYQKVSASGITPEIWMEYYNQAITMKADVDKNGDAISGTRKVKVLALIDSLPITNEQKDALYYYNNWAQSTIKDAPWH